MEDLLLHRSRWDLCHVSTRAYALPQDNEGGDVSWSDLYHRVNYGDLVEPRGEATKEVRFLQTVISQPFDWNVDRKLNLDYIRREFQWYLHGDPTDLRICEHAKIWRGCVNRDDTLSSNYGSYLFTQGGLAKAIQLLKNDEHSRRAVVSIYNQKLHSKPGVRDIPCTCSITFMIRNETLHMGVHMRSNDLVFGLGNDAPCFHWFHIMALWLLREKYGGLKLGQYIHRADSLHAYERHWDMVRKIGCGNGHWIQQKIPTINSAREVKALMAGDRPRTAFGDWLYEVKL